MPPNGRLGLICRPYCPQARMRHLLLGHAVDSGSQTLNAGAERFNLLRNIRLHRVVPVLNFPSRSFSCVPIPLLDHAFELIAPASDDSQVVISEPTPTFLGSTLHLLPVSFNARPIHVNLLNCLESQFPSAT